MSRPSRRRAERCATKDGAWPRSPCRHWRASRTSPSWHRRKLKLSKKTAAPQYVIGIDLGTTNSALAYAAIEPDADAFAPVNVQLLDVPQLVNPGELREESLLPSFLY